jgi:hypothetical protein|tara:strand:- start:343 stop:579 length:237 start_codon:yes stop_codon:yes gene_type:complete
MSGKKVNTLNLSHNGAQSHWEIYKTADGWTAYTDKLIYEGLQFSSGVSGSTEAELYDKMRDTLKNIINFVKEEKTLDA